MYAASDISASAVVVATIVAGVPAVFFIGATARSVYRRTVGRRREIYRRLVRLGNGAQLSFFSSVLGEEPAVRRTVTSTEQEYDERGEATPIERTYTESFWVDSDYYVQTITDGDGTVIAFSVTSRRHRFRPTLVGVWDPSWIEAWRFKRRVGFKYEPLYKVTLGKTRMERAWSGGGGMGLITRWGVGARTHQYSEAHYAGNPGHYQTFVFTNSSTSRGVGPFDFEALSALGRLVRGVEGWQPDPDATPGSRDEEATAVLKRFRRNTAVTTLTIVGPSPFRDADWMPENFGPHEDLLRTLP